MRKTLSRFVAALIASAVVGVASGAAAQSEVTQAPGATVVPLDGSLYTASNGVFEIQQEQTVNLTDENLIFTFRVDDQERMWCYVNGAYASCQNGVRIDFKTGRTGASLNFNPRLDTTPFEAMAECFLDVVSLAQVKGAPVSATFRLSCY